MNRVTHSQRGFTLLELIVVVGLLGLITSLATDYMVNETNQQRYDVTKKRLEQIRYAILGDPSRTLNGSPTISGFVADMGRLPHGLQELLSQPGCSNEDYFYRVECESEGGTWSLAPNWKGPYLTPTAWEAGKPVFRDAWGNRKNIDMSDPTKTDEKNFGWLYFKKSNGDIVLKSNGLDLENNYDYTKTPPELLESDLTEYEKDYPNKGFPLLITKNEYKGTTVNIDTSVTNRANITEVCIDAERNINGSVVNESKMINVIAGKPEDPTFKTESVTLESFSDFYGPITIVIGKKDSDNQCVGDQYVFTNHPLTRHQRMNVSLVIN